MQSLERNVCCETISVLDIISTVQTVKFESREREKKAQGGAQHCLLKAHMYACVLYIYLYTARLHKGLLISLYYRNLFIDLPSTFTSSCQLICICLYLCIFFIYQWIMLICWIFLWCLLNPTPCTSFREHYTKHTYCFFEVVPLQKL
jgi:hypothetical protein